MSEPSITCPRCGLTSCNPTDIREGYCGNCHDWTRGTTVMTLVQCAYHWTTEGEPLGYLYTFEASFPVKVGDVVQSPSGEVLVAKIGSEYRGETRRVTQLPPRSA